MFAAENTTSRSSVRGVTARAGGPRVVTALVLPNVVEFYDFYVFGALAPVLAKVFLPAGDRVTGLLWVFSLFAVAFLASDDAGYVTGVVLPVDGGLSM